MSSSNSSCLAACQRSQSQVRRCTSGRDRRRRSGRGGKRPAWPATPALLRPLLHFLPDQETVSQHPPHRVAIEARPQPSLILVPAQETLGLLVILLHPVPPVRVTHHLVQRYRWPQVAPVVAPLAIGTVFTDQPTGPTLSVALHTVTAHRHERRLQPALAALAPPHASPRPRRLRRYHRLGSLARHAGAPLQGYGEVTTHGNHVTLTPQVQPIQKVRVVAVVGVGGDAHVRHPPGTRVAEQGKGVFRLGLEGDVGWSAGLPPTVGVV